MKNGFTLIELLIVMGLFTILSGLTIINLIKPQQNASQTGFVETMKTDIKSTQLRAISTGQNASITFNSTGYVLYDGFVVSDSLFSISNTFSGNTLTFNKLSGEVINFVNGQNTITVNGTTLNVNKLGVIY